MKAHMIKLTSADTKTDKKRLVPLTDRSFEMLRDTPRLVSGYVFVSHNGRPYHPPAFSSAFKKACARAHLANVVFYDLRHTFCTNMRRAGVDTLTTMAISGHKSLAVFRRYNTIAPQDLRKAIQQFGTSMDTTLSQCHTSPR